MERCSHRLQRPNTGKENQLKTLFWFCSMVLSIQYFIIATVLHQQQQQKRTVVARTTNLGTEQYSPIVLRGDTNRLKSRNQGSPNETASQVKKKIHVSFARKDMDNTNQKSQKGAATVSSNPEIQKENTSMLPVVNRFHSGVRKDTFNVIAQVPVKKEYDKKGSKKVDDDDEPLPTDLFYEGADPVLWPILHKGKLYSVCRGDRSGSFIADMLYAHSFAFAHNVTYAGNCCVTRGIPKAPTRNLIEDLHWNKIIPLQCPQGVNNKIYNVLYPNATTINPLMLNPNVYRLQGARSNFKPAWKESIRDALLEYSDTSPNRPFEIAVHIRRGDVTPCTYKRRYLPNDHYMQLIDKYTPSETELNGRPVQVTIYSESDTFEPFDVFVERKYTLELDSENLSDVWHALSTADVAILSRSYFSIVPAIINPNTVVATEFFDFNVTVMDGWEYADPTLVKASDKMNHEMYLKNCNSTEPK
jgi:hypothetical protein